MKTFREILKWILIIFGSISLLLTFAITFHKSYFNTSFLINTELAAEFGSFFGGFIGTILTLLSVLLIIYTIVSQSLENRKNLVKDNFYRMLDLHTNKVNNLKISHIDIRKKNSVSEGRRAFVIFKLQISALLKIINEINTENNLSLSYKQVIDIAYICFFYGIDKRWSDFSQEMLDEYEHSDIIIRQLLKKIQ